MEKDAARVDVLDRQGEGKVEGLPALSLAGDYALIGGRVVINTNRLLYAGILEKPDGHRQVEMVFESGDRCYMPAEEGKTIRDYFS